MIAIHCRQHFNAYSRTACWIYLGSMYHLIFPILFYKTILCEGFDDVDVVFHFQEHAIITSF